MKDKEEIKTETVFANSSGMMAANPIFERRRLLSFKIIQDTSHTPHRLVPCVLFNLNSGKDAEQFEKENPKLAHIQAYKRVSDDEQSYAYPLT